MMSTRTPTVQGNGLISPVVIGKKARFLGQKIENSWFSPKNTGDLESISLDCPKTRFQRAIFFWKKANLASFHIFTQSFRIFKHVIPKKNYVPSKKHSFQETDETPLVITPRALLSTLVFCIDQRSKAQSITCSGSWSIWSSREYKSSRVLLLLIAYWIFLLIEYSCSEKRN